MHILHVYFYRMSCKNANISKNKHYTTLERKVFLEILDRFKDVIERKKSDNTSLKEKEVAWKEICTTYNESAIITQQVR